LRRRDSVRGVQAFALGGILGKRIHQVHVKNGSKLMRETDTLDWPRLPQELFDPP
jgi:hypothetical protein